MVMEDLGRSRLEILNISLEKGRLVFPLFWVFRHGAYPTPWFHAMPRSTAICEASPRTLMKNDLAGSKAL